MPLESVVLAQAGTAERLPNQVPWALGSLELSSINFHLLSHFQNLFWNLAPFLMFEVDVLYSPEPLFMRDKSLTQTTRAK